MLLAKDNHLSDSAGCTLHQLPWHSCFLPRHVKVKTNCVSAEPFPQPLPARAEQALLCDCGFHKRRQTCLIRLFVHLALWISLEAFKAIQPTTVNRAPAWSLGTPASFTACTPAAFASTSEMPLVCLSYQICCSFFPAVSGLSKHQAHFEPLHSTFCTRTSKRIQKETCHVSTSASSLPRPLSSAVPPAPT